MKSRRVVSSWCLFGLIAGHLSTPVAAAPSELVFEYKGIRLGATEQQFRAKHPDFTCRAGPEILEHRICSRRGATYAGLEAQSTEARFLRNRLGLIHVKFFSLGVSGVTDVIVRLDAALTERYGKPHEGGHEWKEKDPNTSIRSTNWYGRKSSLHVISFWHLDESAYETTVSIVLDGYWDELFRLRAQNIDKAR